jgi:hypothetical protein
MNSPEICLQINLCPGDVEYAEQTVPHLVNSHRNHVQHRLAIVDVNKPQNTRANLREYPEPQFSDNVNRILEITESLCAAGYFDEVLIIDENQNELKKSLSKKFTGDLIPADTSHDYHGAAYAAYLAAMHVPEQRFILHYDSDILLYQEPGFDWAQVALSHWQSNSDIIAACPRISPPGFTPDAPSKHEGRPHVATEGGWLNDWFSTRCFLMDQKRLAHYLPLTHGPYFWELLFYRMIKRRYPPGPELLLFNSAGRQGAKKLNLSTDKAWLLHPASKPAEFLQLLPAILQHVRYGRCPDTQQGQADIDLAAWSSFIDCSPTS